MFYETIDDITADAGIRVRAGTLKELFCRALLATFNEITDIERIEPRDSYEIQAQSPLPFLLADIINEALVLHESKGFVASKCEVLELDESHVKVRLLGERFDPQRHPPKLVIKAATYHRLRVERENSHYVGEVIFDI
ncbi:archease [Hydrogenivirga sp.]